MARKSVAEAAAAAEKHDDTVVALGIALTPAAAARFEPEMPVKLLQESPKNPRKRFTPESMRELEESVRVKGVVTPLLVRRAPGRVADVYEIAAGHRRYRAALAVGRPTVPVLIREMPEEEFLELLVMENDQREDVHELEEAAGYQQLLGLPGYDVAKIASRVGRSPKYVYDRLKLLELTPKAQELFLRELFSAGHAILLARLKPEDQERAIEVDEGHGAYIGGVFELAGGLPFDEDFEAAAKKNPYLLVKAVSVREFEEWIQDNVRVEPEHVDGFLFPETAEALQDVDPDKVILVTHDYQAPDAVRKAGDKKVFGEGSWRRADGKEKSKACEHARVALIACGARQQEALMVCIAKEKCAVHWASWQKERKERQAQASSPRGAATERERQEKEKAQRAAAEVKEQADQKAWRKAVPALRQAAAAIIRGAKVTANGPIADLVVARIRPDKSTLIPRGKTAEDLVRYLAFDAATSEMGDYQWAREAAKKRLTALGVDVRKILTATAAPALQTAAEPGAKGKKARR